MKRSVVVACAMVLGITACEGPSVDTTISTDPTTTITSRTAGAARELDSAHDSGERLDLSVKDLDALGYQVTAVEAGTNKPITDDFVHYKVVFFNGNAGTGIGLLFARHYDPTPEESVDIAVEQAGLAPAVSGFADAAALVHRMCGVLTPSSDAMPAEALNNQVRGDAGKLRIAEIGIPLLCPDQQAVLHDLEVGNLPIPEGRHEIGTGLDQVRPGTYRTTGSFDDCYWERTRADGKIIDSKFATHSQQITVTISSTDGSFSSQRCGKWIRVN
jgi:hypothetical protein